MLGNATLLGIGYLLLRRPVLAAVSAAVSLGLLSLVTASPDATVWRAMLPIWWVLLVLHALRLAHRAARARFTHVDDQKPPRRNLALAAACLLAVAFGWYRFDAWNIVSDAEAAHADGDCGLAVATLRWLGAGHSLAHGSVVARGEEEGEACRLLLAAHRETDSHSTATALAEYLRHPAAAWDGAGPLRAELLFDTALVSDRPRVGTIEEAFRQLTETLEAEPGQSREVREIVESFLADLTEVPPCKAQAIDEWLLAQDWSSSELAEPVAAEADHLPARILDCADDVHPTAASEAGAAYQAFLAAYPEHELATRAVQSLLTNDLYCEHPAAYAGAPAYDGKGPHAMWLDGLNPDDYGFPDSWTTSTVGETVLVVCVEGPERGDHQETCYYEPGADQLLAPFQEYAEVDFYATAFAVKAYELHTGELVAEYTEEIGDPCPDELEYDYYYFDSVPSEYDSDYSDADVRAIFKRIVG